MAEHPLSLYSFHLPYPILGDCLTSSRSIDESSVLFGFASTLYGPLSPCITYNDRYDPGFCTFCSSLHSRSSIRFSPFAIARFYLPDHYHSNHSSFRSPLLHSLARYRSLETREGRFSIYFPLLYGLSMPLRSSRFWFTLFTFALPYHQRFSTHFYLFVPFTRLVHHQWFCHVKTIPYYIVSSCTT